MNCGAVQCFMGQTEVGGGILLDGSLSLSLSPHGYPPNSGKRLPGAVHQPRVASTRFPRVARDRKLTRTRRDGAQLARVRQAPSRSDTDTQRQYTYLVYSALVRMAVKCKQGLGQKLTR